MTNLFNPPKRVDVDLSPYADQNAYAIGGAWEVEARRQGWSKEDIRKVVIEAQTADYDHLLDVYFEHSDDCVFVVGPQTGDMRRGKRPFAKINWEVK